MSYKRLQFNQYGDPLTVLSVETVHSVPAPGDDEILIEVIANPINPYDLALIQGVQIAYAPADGNPPHVPGSEGVGRVRSLGKNVTEFTAGQRVAFFCHKRAWSQYLLLQRPFSDVISVPDEVPDTSASQLVINPLTAYGLLDHSKASKDDWILQTAAASVLGQMLIELAKAKGLKLINVVRRRHQVDELKSRYGKDTHVVVFDGTNEDEALAQAKAITEGKGVKHVFEAVAGSTFSFALKTLAQQGHLLSYGMMSGNIQVEINLGQMLSNSSKIESFVVTPWMMSKSPAEMKKIMDELIDLMVSRQLVPAVESVHSFEEFKEAIVSATKPGKLGRLLLAPHPEKVTKN